MGFGTPKAQAKRRKQIDEGRQWRARQAVREAVLTVLVGINISQTHLIDVAVYGELLERALKPQAIDIERKGDRGLVIVDGDNQIKLLYLPWAIPPAVASKLGVEMGLVLDEVKEHGTPAVRHQMWYVGNVVARSYGARTIYRTLVERHRPNLKTYADDLLRRIVMLIRCACSEALYGHGVLTDMERALSCVVPCSCVTSAALTRGYRTEHHVDKNDIIEGPYGAFMSAVVWCGEGGDVLQSGCWFVLHDFKMRLAMPSGAVLLFDSLRIEHGTVGPKEGSTGMAPGQVARMGIALHCMKQALDIAKKDAALIEDSYNAVCTRRVLESKLQKNYQLSGHDIEMVTLEYSRTVWPETEAPKLEAFLKELEADSLRSAAEEPPEGA